MTAAASSTLENSPTKSAQVSPGIVTEPNENDVLCGRGGSINSWKGNENFRTLVERRKRVYLTARFKREKRLIASSVVSEIQALDPPGRFLSRNAKTGTWFVIDDDKARDKVSQALRENAPSVRAEIETEIHEQRAELHRSQPHPAHPPTGPQNPYYGAQPGWGYFSYYGYAQQSTHHGPSPPPMPPPPPHGPPQPLYAHHPSHPPCYPPGAPLPPQLSPHPSESSSPSSYIQQQQQQPPFTTPPSIRAPAHPAAPRQQEGNNEENDDQQKQQDDDKSIFDALSESMSAILSPSLASWNLDAFSIGGGMSVTSHKEEDKDETVSVASRPIQYVHQPEDRSVASQGSKARSVHFKDERSLSGRTLEPQRRILPPRIMHSSNINYPRKPKMIRRRSHGNSVPRVLNPTAGSAAPVSSVNVDNYNDGMISLITTEGMNSIMEDGPLAFEEYEKEMEKQVLNEETKDDADQDLEPIDHRRMPQRRSSSGNMSTGEQSNSMLTAVANQVVMGMGSRDTNTAARGTDGATPRSIDVPREINQYSENMAVEIEGQEVQLVDDNDMMDMGDNSVVESRIPGDDKDRIQLEDWPSRIGSCLGGASLADTSFFSRSSRGSNGVSPAGSMDMDLSTGTDPFSCAGSIGGASLCRVFDAEVQRSAPLSQSMGYGVLAHLPSWERSMRSRSPLSLDSGEFDNQSSKGSEKLMGGSISSVGSGDNNDKSQEGLTWNSFTKE